MKQIKGPINKDLPEFPVLKKVRVGPLQKLNRVQMRQI
jgi:hypothetical protein